MPAFHKAVFRVEFEDRTIVNIGGIANITVLPRQPHEVGVGFDTGPGNGLMDYWIEKHSDCAYDGNGDWARDGTVDPELLENMLQDSFFNETPPKSTGKEYFSPVWLESMLAKTRRQPAPQDIQATLAHLSASAISDAIKRYGPSTDRVLVCGGGAHNSFLMELVGQRLNCPVLSTAAAGIDPDWIEAMAFAWLAKQTLDGLCGNLPHVTGAKTPAILGGIYPGTCTQPT